MRGPPGAASSDAFGAGAAAPGQNLQMASRIVRRSKCPKSISSSPNFTFLLPQIFRQVHQLRLVAISLVKLQHGEFGLVNRVDSFVAEISVDLVHAIQPANNQPLQIKFRRDAQIQGHVECVVVRYERTRRGATKARMHPRRRHFEVASRVEKMPYFADDLRAANENLTAASVHD